jgi:hypothetical protein
MKTIKEEKVAELEKCNDDCKSCKNCILAYKILKLQSQEIDVAEIKDKVLELLERSVEKEYAMG